jgi:hypothetical protein
MSKVTGALTFRPLKGGGVTVTIDVPDAPDIGGTIAKLSGMFGQEVEIGLPQPQNPADLSKTPLETARDSLMGALDALNAISEAESKQWKVMDFSNLTADEREILRKKLNEQPLPLEHPKQRCSKCQLWDLKSKEHLAPGTRNCIKRGYHTADNEIIQCEFFTALKEGEEA